MIEVAHIKDGKREKLKALLETADESMIESMVNYLLPHLPDPILTGDRYNQGDIKRHLKKICW